MTRAKNANRKDLEDLKARGEGLDLSPVACLVYQRCALEDQVPFEVLAVALLIPVLRRYELSQ